MACISLEQFELAEEYLLQAVDIFKKANEDSIVFKVKHNLGLMYADQGLSEVAIRHLTDVFNEIKYTRPGYFSRTAYLLAREHYKMKRPEKVAYYIEDGLRDCSEEYKHHFSILPAKNNNLSVEELEGIILPAIEYLKEQELWKDVVAYSDDLAKKWYDIGNKEKVSTYFHLNYEARQTFKKKGSLK
jgi:tetratricopeptide (TPR) repeat protein